MAGRDDLTAAFAEALAEPPAAAARPVSALNIALDLAGRGWPVFPCKADKTPTTDHGHLEATCSVDETRRLFSERPGPMVGINTGAAGLVVLDIDVKNGADGYETFANVSHDLGVDLTDTMLVDTPSGGQHVYFAAGPYRVGCDNKGKLVGPGVDVKAERGYVIAPGSGNGHASYITVDGHGFKQLRELPPALGERLAFASRPSSRQASPRRQHSADDSQPIPEGSRNATLASMAGKMRRDGWSSDELEAALLVANAKRCRPPLADREVHAIAGSIGKYPPKTTATQAEAAPEGAPAPAAGGHFPPTELGNAERLAARHKGRVFAVRGADELRGYDPARGHLTADRGLLVRYACEIVRSMYSEAGDALTDDGQRPRASMPCAARPSARSTPCSTSPSRWRSLEAEPEDFDADPELLNCTNGVVNLRTGERRDHDPKYRMTKMAGAAYDPDAPCPVWRAELERIFAGDAETIAFMQTLFGYALTGYAGEQIFAIFHGVGANGRVVLVDSWLAAMGDYGGTAAMKTFLAHRTEAVRTDLAVLNGRRLVSTSESKPGQLIDAATIKVLTSKHVTCRFNYQRGEFTYTPQYPGHLGHQLQAAGAVRRLRDQAARAPGAVQRADSRRGAGHELHRQADRRRAARHPRLGGSRRQRLPRARLAGTREGARRDRCLPRRDGRAARVLVGLADVRRPGEMDHRGSDCASPNDVGQGERRGAKGPAQGLRMGAPTA